MSRLPLEPLRVSRSSLSFFYIRRRRHASDYGDADRTLYRHLEARRAEIERLRYWRQQRPRVPTHIHLCYPAQILLFRRVEHRQKLTLNTERHGRSIKATIAAKVDLASLRFASSDRSRAISSSRYLPAAISRSAALFSRKSIVSGARYPDQFDPFLPTGLPRRFNSIGLFIYQINCGFDSTNECSSTSDCRGKMRGYYMAPKCFFC